MYSAHDHVNYSAHNQKVFQLPINCPSVGGYQNGPCLQAGVIIVIVGQIVVDI